MWRKLARPTLHERDEPALRRGVALQARSLGAGRLDSRGRTGQHDGSASPACDQRGDGRIDGVPGADEVDVNDVAEGPAGIVAVGEPDDACVGDDDVEAAELSKSLANYVVDRGGVAHVRHARDDP